MNLLTPLPNDEQLDALTNDELRDLLQGAVVSILDNLFLAARVWRKLVDRGLTVELSTFPLARFMRRLADGLLLPAVVTRFYLVNEPLVNALSGFPVKLQEDLALGKPVPLATFEPDGNITHRLVDPAVLRAPQIKQVFDRDRIRDVPEQVAMLEAMRTAKAAAVPFKIGVLKLDPEMGGAHHRGEFIPLADLAAAVNALRK